MSEKRCAGCGHRDDEHVRFRFARFDLERDPAWETVNFFGPCAHISDPPCDCSGFLPSKEAQP